MKPDDLNMLTVGRGYLIESTLESLTSTVSEGGGRFDLVVGPSGSGKSHFLEVVRYRFQRIFDVESAEAIRIGQEAHVASLPHLLAQILQQLSVSREQRMPSWMQRLQTMNGIAGIEAKQLADAMDIIAVAWKRERSRAVDSLRGAIKTRLNGRPLVIFWDELDRGFSSLGRGERRPERTLPEGLLGLRSILQEEGSWTILGTAYSVDTSFVSPGEPFYGGAAIRSLAELSVEECRELVVRLSYVTKNDDLSNYLASRKGLGRIAAVHHLIGGWPRPFAILFRYATPDTLEELTDVLANLADELTPNCEARLATLSPGKRSTIETLLGRGRPMSVSEIAGELYDVSPQSTSNQLRQLRNDRLVTSMSVGRESYYEITDPLQFFCREMRVPEGRLQKFSMFLRDCYSKPGVVGGLSFNPAQLSEASGLAFADLKSFKLLIREHNENEAKKSFLPRYARCSRPERLFFQILAYQAGASWLVEFLEGVEQWERPASDIGALLLAPEDLARWFLENFEDPANHVSYESKEGGYQYIFGGPYDAEEELRTQFFDVGDEVIAAAIEKIAENGGPDWVKRGMY